MEVPIKLSESIPQIWQLLEFKLVMVFLQLLAQPSHLLVLLPHLMDTSKVSLPELALLNWFKFFDVKITERVSTAGESTAIEYKENASFIT